MTDAAIIFRSHYDAILNLPEADQLSALKALIEYCMDGKMESAGVEAAILMMAKPVLDKWVSKREAGQSGGKAERKQSESKREANVKQTESKREPKEKEKEKVKEREREKEKAKDKNTNARARVAMDPDPEVDDAIEEFIKHRRTLRRPMSDRAVSLLVAKLNRLANTPQEKVELINTAIERGWLTIYEPKEEKKVSGLPDWGSI